MDLTPQTLDEAEFREAKKGYNTEDVDEFLERVREGVLRKDAQLREALGRVEAAEERVAEAERAAAEASGPSEIDETLKRTLVLAQRTADAAIKDAEEQAARTIAAAQDQSARMLADAQESSARARSEADAEARRAHEEARARVVAELQELEATRDQLHGDVELLGRHLVDQRDRLRQATNEMQRLLDDPGPLRDVAAPTVTPISVPAAESSPASEALAPSVTATSEEPAPAAQPELSLEPEPEPEEEQQTVDLSDPWSSSNETWNDAPYGEGVEVGPPTEAVDVLQERDADDDEYLAELRKAMTDEAPLGPRDEYEEPSFDMPRSRFGRRR